MDKHVVWSGELYHSREDRDLVAPGESLWAVLMRESVFGPKRLELFHRYTDYSDSRPPCVILDLSDMLHVERDLEATPVNLTRSQPFFTHVRFGDEGNTTSRSLIPQLWHQFTISTEEEALVFATRTGEESSLWVGKLNELLHGPPERGIEYEFPVRIQQTTLSQNFALHGNHVLKVSETNVQFYEVGGTVPTLFSCPLENIKKVDETHGTGSGTISLHCTNICGTSGTMAFSTKSTADISRIINHRQITAAAANDPPTHNSSSGNHSHSIQTPHHHQNYFTDLHLVDDQALSSQNYPCLDRSTSADTGVVSHALPFQLLGHYRSSTSVELRLDNQQHPTASRVRQLCSHHGNGPHRQHSTPNVHSSVTRVTTQTAGISLKKMGETVREGRLLSDSDEQEDDDEEEEDEIVTAAQLQDMKSRKGSIGYLESVASWVKMEDGVDRVIDGEHSKGRGTTPELTSKESNSNNGRNPLSWESHPSYLSSLGNTIDEEQESYFKRVPSLNLLDEGPEMLVHNESYEPYDINSWRTRQPAVSIANGNHSQPSSMKSRQPQSLHDHDSTKEVIMQPQSLPDYLEITEALGNYSLLEASETNLDQDDTANTPDYDYVKHRILGVRGLPGQQPHPLGDNIPAEHSSDEDEHYYY